jgi:hypothetical protein
MKKKALTLTMALTLSLSTGITAFATPAVMDDGSVFDAEYYAQNNPDVVQALGTDVNALYNHYVNFGKTEGRLPYAIGTDVNTVLLSAQADKLTSTTVGHEKLVSSQEVDRTKIWGKENIITMITSKKHTAVLGDVTYGEIGLTYRIGTPKSGYEWYYADWYFYFSGCFDSNYNVKYNVSDVPVYYCKVDVDNSSNWQRVDSTYGDIAQYVNIGTCNAQFDINKGNPFDYAYFVFDVEYNGVTYPAICVVEAYCNEGFAWFMLPEGCEATKKVSIMGTKLENGEIKIDRENI